MRQVTRQKGMSRERQETSGGGQETVGGSWRQLIPGIRETRRRRRRERQTDGRMQMDASGRQRETDPTLLLLQLSHPQALSPTLQPERRRVEGGREEERENMFAA